MKESRWRLRLGLLALVVLAAASVASTSLGAGGPSASGSAAACPDGPAPGALDTPVPRGPEDLSNEPWFRMAPVLSGDGVLEGRRLTIGRYGSSGTRSMTLAAESFAAGPHGRAVLYGSDDGTRSELALFDPARDCVVELGQERDVIRGATLDPGGTHVYEHRVERRSRADLGVFRRRLTGGAPVRVMAPVAADDAYGVTYSTELAWSAEGDALAVQSCGALLCRTRILDPQTGEVTTVGAGNQGELIGLAEGRLVTHAPCGGLPCPILTTDVAEGASEVLAEAAGLATLVHAVGGPRVVLETGDGTLRITDVAGAETRSIRLPDPNLRLVPRPSRSQAGSRIPEGWVALGREARVEPAELAPGMLLRIADGSPWELQEAGR